MLLLAFSSLLIAKKSKDLPTLAKERLKKNDIQMTDENFFKYLAKDNGDVIRDFLDAGYDANIRDQKHDPAVLIAAEKDYREVLQVLLEKGADPDAADWDKTTPLMYACFYQNTQAVELLILHKAKVNLQNRAGWTALMFAIKAGNGSTIDAVITKDTDLTLKNCKGQTPVEMAESLKYHYLKQYLTDKVEFLNDRYAGKNKMNIIKLKEL
jgi:ankyrin repeat protein